MSCLEELKKIVKEEGIAKPNINNEIGFNEFEYDLDARQ